MPPWSGLCFTSPCSMLDLFAGFWLCLTKTSSGDVNQTFSPSRERTLSRVSSSADICLWAKHQNWILSSGESNIELEFAESSTVRDILGKMEELNCLYTVQVVPRTDQDSFEVFVFDHKDMSTGSKFLRNFNIKVFRWPNLSVIYIVSTISTGWVKKTGISKNMAITTLKSIRKGKNWCVLENSA